MPGPLELYRRWKASNNDVGCVFARFMARRPMEYGQQAELVNGADPTTLATEIETRVSARVADHAVVAAALIFPDLTELRSLVAVGLALANKPGWRVTTSVLTATPAGDALAFHILRDIPTETASCPSEALILGPFDCFPRTRRAPVTALEIFVGSPGELQRNGKPRTKANLADVQIEIYLPSASTFTSMWDKSGEWRLQSLGGVDDHRGKAKVAFAIPMDLAAKLGCAP